MQTELCFSAKSEFIQIGFSFSGLHKFFEVNYVAAEWPKAPLLKSMCVG